MTTESSSRRTCESLPEAIDGLTEAINALAGIVYASLPAADRRPGVLVSPRPIEERSGPHSASCPECGAGVGKPCRSLRGDPLDVSHGARRQVGASVCG